MRWFFNRLKEIWKLHPPFCKYHTCLNEGNTAKLFNVSSWANENCDANTQRVILSLPKFWWGNGSEPIQNQGAKRRRDLWTITANLCNKSNIWRGKVDQTCYEIPPAAVCSARNASRFYLACANFDYGLRPPLRMTTIIFLLEIFSLTKSWQMQQFIL